MANDFPAAIDGISSGGDDEWYITNARYLFYGGARWDIKDLLMSRFKDVTDMEGMFYNFGRLTALDASGLVTSQVKSIKKLFSGCSQLTSLDLSSWNTSNVTNMNEVFGSCLLLTSLDLSSWDTSNVTDMGNVFTNCQALTSLSLSSWDTSKTTNMYGLFNQCTVLTEILGFSAMNKAGLSITFPSGSSSKVYALKRLTFRTDLPDGVYSIRSAINIKYCSFERDGMVEMFNTLPDVSGLTHSASYKTITITGNPCVTNATLTAEDEAIATAKGWTLVK